VKGFRYAVAADTAEATELAEASDTRYVAGGTNLVDVMRAGVESPDRLVDISRLPLGEIHDLPDGGLRIGALASNAQVAGDDRVRRRYPMLAEAIVRGASAQLRNRATTGGNLLQRTRCGYFYDTAAACNKRVPGAGCDAIGGFHQTHAILGASDACVAVHPSDMCVALAALDAMVHIEGVGGVRRTVPLVRLHRLPGQTPHVETVLERGELVTAVQLPPALAGRSRYVKVRDRASYAFALVSVAILIAIEAGRVTAARIALGGVAAKPWRAHSAEELLIGAPPGAAIFERAAREAVAGARPLPSNAFKCELTRRLVERTLTGLAAELDTGDSA
jgi:xanthine dehydrogenase YagS FAD-binding subunit